MRRNWSWSQKVLIYFTGDPQTTPKSCIVAFKDPRTGELSTATHDCTDAVKSICQAGLHFCFLQITVILISFHV